MVSFVFMIFFHFVGSRGVSRCSPGSVPLPIYSFTKSLVSACWVLPWQQEESPGVIAPGDRAPWEAGKDVHSQVALAAWPGLSCILFD